MGLSVPMRVRGQGKALTQFGKIQGLIIKFNPNLEPAAVAGRAGCRLG